MSEPVECRITDQGFVFSCNGQSLGPLYDIEELAAVDIAHKFGVKPKSVADAKFRSIQEELEKEISWDYVAEILSATIKRDKPTKLITFAAMLLAQTDGNTNNDSGACGELAAFINQVNVQKQRGQLTPEEAAQLIQLANVIKASLGCP